MSIANPAILQELAARQSQVLNLEERQLVLFVVFQLLFVGFFWLAPDRGARMDRSRLAIALSMFAVSAHLLAINAKMTMIAEYMKLLEGQIEASGIGFVFWDRVIVPLWFFASPNSFLIGASLVVVVMAIQLVVVFCLAGANHALSRFSMSSGIVGCAIVVLLLGVHWAGLGYSRMPQEVIARLAVR